jgi:hypothetical protein
MKKLVILLVFTYLVIIGGLSFGTGFRLSSNFVYFQVGHVSHYRTSRLHIAIYDKEDGSIINFDVSQIDVVCDFLNRGKPLNDVVDNGEIVFFSGYVIGQSDFQDYINLKLTYISPISYIVDRTDNEYYDNYGDIWASQPRLSYIKPADIKGILPPILKLTIVSIPFSFGLLNLYYMKKQSSQRPYIIAYRGY